jgi:RNA polymerase sigma factor (sigma-70 family)
MNGSRPKPNISQGDLDGLLKRLTVAPADEEAWASLYRQLRPFVIAVIYRRFGTRNRSAAEDATHEVFIRLLRSRPFGTIPDASALRAYVWRMAENVAKSHLRKQRTEEGAERDFAEWHESETFVEALDGDSALVARELLDLAQHSLDATDSNLLRLMIEGASLGQAADKMSLSYSNAGVRLHRMRRKLVNLLNSQKKEMTLTL